MMKSTSSLTGAPSPDMQHHEIKKNGEEEEEKVLYQNKFYIRIMIYYHK